MKVRFVIAAGILLLALVAASNVGAWVVPASSLAAILVIHRRASRLLRRRVEGRSGELRRLSFAALEEMVAAEVDHAEYTTTGSIDVIVSRCDADTLRVVVRGSALVLFYTLLRFDAFYATRDGRVWPMPRPEYHGLE